MTANTTDLQPNEGTTVEEQPHVTLIPFGSYRLGVHRPNSDLDCLVLTSAEVVKRVDFFSSWVELLRSDPNISHVHPIPNAFTPVLKFLYRPTESVSGDGDDAVQLDLLFARVRDASRLSEFLSHRKHALQSPQPKLAAPFWTSPSYTEYYWIDDHDLPDQDAAGIRSINGCRVTQIILQLIAGYDGAGGRANAERMLPDNLSEGGYVSRMRLQRYQEVLCIIKQWAINAGIYSNALGFLGGVNWAILVAWICLTSQEFLEPQRLQSDAIVSILLRRFFVVFDRWKWPAPVMLTPIQLAPPKEFAFGSVHPSTATSAVKSLNAELQPWNPAVVKRDRFHIMPILTPAWPAMNSAYNVGVPQLRRMRDEFSRSRERLVSVRNHDVLPALFDLGNFFDRHKHFLVITMTTARTETADVHKQWCQYLESKLRLLLVSLDTTEIHPWPYSKFFHDHGEQVYRTYFIMALRFAPQVSNVNLQPLTSDWLQRINSWSGRTASLDLKLEHTVDVNLPLCVREEIVNSGRLVGQLRQLTPAKSTASGGGGGDCDSDDNGSRASDRSYVSVASSFSSVVHQQTKRSRGSDGGAVEGNK
jgi:poly(A) polymerase